MEKEEYTTIQLTRPTRERLAVYKIVFGCSNYNMAINDILNKLEEVKKDGNERDKSDDVAL